MNKNNIKIGSNKSFGIVFFIFFLIISIYPLIDGSDLRVSLLVISIIFLILGLLNSKILTPLNEKGVLTLFKRSYNEFAWGPLLGDPLRRQQPEQPEQKRLISVFIHSPKTQENESFLRPN